MLCTRVLCTILACAAVGSAATATGYQHGMVVRMHMGDCVLAHHGFMNTFGPPQAPAEEPCPEYTLVSDKVVFIIVGKSSKEFVPLAQVVDFRFQKNELTIRIDDERKESRFVIKEMTLRTQWECSNSTSKKNSGMPPTNRRVRLPTASHSDQLAPLSSAKNPARATPV